MSHGGVILVAINSANIDRSPLASVIEVLAARHLDRRCSACIAMLWPVRAGRGRLWCGCVMVVPVACPLGLTLNDVSHHAVTCDSLPLCTTTGTGGRSNALYAGPFPLIGAAASWSAGLLYRLADAAAAAAVARCYRIS